MVQSCRMIFSVLIMLSSWMSITGAVDSENDHEQIRNKPIHSNFEKQHADKQARIDIDLNKPYIPEYSSARSSNDEHNLPSDLVKDTATGRTAPTSSNVYKPRKAPSEYVQTRRAKRQREQMQMLRDQGGGLYRAHLDRKNRLKRERREKIESGKDKEPFPKGVRMDGERIKQARKRVREGNATEVDHFIVDKRRKIEAQSRKLKPRIRKNRIPYGTILREKVRTGIASPHESERVRKMQLRDREYQKKRYHLKKDPKNVSNDASE